MIIQELIEASTVSTIVGRGTKIYTIMHGTQTQSMNGLQFVPKPLDQTVYNIWELN